MSDFYAIFSPQFDGTGCSIVITDRLSLERIILTLDHEKRDLQSQSPPFPTWEVGEQLIREWATTLNDFVRYIDDRKALNNE